MLVCCLITSLLIAQTPNQDPEYKRLVDSAYVLLQQGHWQPCIEQYEAAFARSKHSALSHLRAALCAERCRDNEKSEQFLQAAAAISWGNCESILDNPDYYPEFSAIAGTAFEQKIRQAINAAATAAGINFELKKQLAQIQYDDQKYRKMIDSIQALHPQGSEAYQAFIRDWMKMDSLNAAKIIQIIDEHGYPGRTIVGDGQASTAWLVIQHAPLETQVKYLPLITEAAEKGELRKADWALLVDRIRMRQGKPQLYGSQVIRDEETGQWKFHDIEDEANVNARRAEVGLGPLEDYAQHFGFDWVAPEKD